ncbi:MAG: hypothetical protein AAB874_02025 [Patescibacteria group bacterium]
MRNVEEWFRRATGFSISIIHEPTPASLSIKLYDFNDLEKAAKNDLPPGFYITLSPISINPKKIDPQLLHNYSADIWLKLKNEGLLPNDVIIGPPYKLQPVAYQPSTKRLLVKVEIINNK